MLRTFNGRPWCYVNRPNSCSDEFSSKRCRVREVLRWLNVPFCTQFMYEKEKTS